MKYKIGLAQTCHPEDGDVIALVERFLSNAQQAGVQLLVFPESLMSVYESEKQAFLNEAEPVGGPYTQAIDALAAKYGMWVVYTLNEYNPEGNPFNTALVVDSEGKRRGVYRKVHLFDTDFTQESDRMAPGDALFEPIETPFGKLGLAICYDLRFPELTRAAALKGCDIFVYPAAWVDGSLKAHQWRTLLTARAIENQVFVVGVSRADARYIGQSILVDPYGEVLAEGGIKEELIVGEIDTDTLTAIRKAMPVFAHRRVDVYNR